MQALELAPCGDDWVAGRERNEGLSCWAGAFSPGRHPVPLLFIAGGTGYFFPISCTGVSDDIGKSKYVSDGFDGSFFCQSSVFRMDNTGLVSLEILFCLRCSCQGGSGGMSLHPA